MRTAAYEVSKFVLRSTTQIKTKRNPDITFLRAWISAYCTIALLKVCLAVTNPSKDEEKPRHRISPCMDVTSWTIASIPTFLSPSTIPILYHVKDEAKSDIVRRRISPCMDQTSPCQRRSSNRHRISPCTDQQRQTKSKTKQIQRHISPYMDQTCFFIPVARHIFFA